MGYKSIDSIIGWRLPPAAKAVLLAIAHRRNDVTGQCNPGLDDLAEISCLGRRTVIRQLQALERLGALVVVRKTGTPNQYQPVPYAVTSANLAPVPTVHVTSANHDMDPCQPRHQPVPKLGTRIEEEDEETKKKSEPDDWLKGEGEREGGNPPVVTVIKGTPVGQPVVPRKFPDWRATHSRAFIGRERADWEALFEAYGWDPMHDMHESITEPRIYFNVASDWLSREYELKEQA